MPQSSSILVIGGALGAVIVSLGLLFVGLMLSGGESTASKPVPDDNGVAGATDDYPQDPPDTTPVPAPPAPIDYPTEASDNGKPNKFSLAGNRAGQEWSGNGLKMAFCWCPPGQFRMGERSDQVNVTLSRGFWLSRTEVTQGQWQELMSTSPWEGQAFAREGSNYAASYISWDDAMDFCRKLTAQERSAGRLPAGWEYALPTEAQWEYACRAGSITTYCFGDDESRLEEYAWFDQNADDIGDEYAHAVGQKSANAWGLRDMHGNVWEWCRDYYTERLPGGRDPEVTGEGASLRVLRGGSWNYDNRYCRSAIRNWYSPDYRNLDLGFRVAAVHSGSK